MCESVGLSNDDTQATCLASVSMVGFTVFVHVSVDKVMNDR